MTETPDGRPMGFAVGDRIQINGIWLRTARVTVREADEDDADIEAKPGDYVIVMELVGDEAPS